MRKIKTIFQRDWDGSRKVTNELSINMEQLRSCFATEKIDGTNIRVTMRSGTVVRVEKRKNPSKIQKQKGIVEPWYVDARREDTQDKWIFNAIDNTDLSHIPDGAWSAEAFGKNIQGNPLKLDKNMVFVFDYPTELEKIQLEKVPLDYEGLKNFLENARSYFNPSCQIEGIVWHNSQGDRFKIKRKDF